MINNDLCLSIPLPFRNFADKLFCQILYRDNTQRLFNISVQICFLTGINDTSNAFKMFRTKLVRDLPIDSRSFTVSAEMMLRMKIAGYKICQIPVTWTDRTEGMAKFRLRNTFYNYFLLLLRMLKLQYIDGFFRR